MELLRKTLKGSWAMHGLVVYLDSSAKVVVKLVKGQYSLVKKQSVRCMVCSATLTKVLTW